MTFDQLKEKAHTLPLEPGVYLMQDRNGQVIYVGKAKKLRNRVSQYFQDSSAHTAKTRIMVGQIHHFDVIVAASEFEALVLECSLIKRHMPKYNILLKDDKGYPYLRIDMREEYPVMTLESKVLDDGADYYGPYGGRYITQQLIDTIRLTFKLPGCGKKFPRDIGKERPCLNYHMNNCDAWCRLGKSPEAYKMVMKQVVLLLQGKYQQVSAQLRTQMEKAAENLEFERAAALRDRLLAIENLGKKQLVTAGTMAHTDVIGYYQSEAKACFSVLHYVEGSLLDKDYEIVSVSDSREEAISTLVKQYYLSRNCAPKEILLPCEMEDSQLFAELLFQNLNKRVHIRVPQRGDNVRLVDLANLNAREEAERATSKEERNAGILNVLQGMLGLPERPARIEAYDISNTAGTDIVASMIVFADGRPQKRGYKRFQIKSLEEQDDYASMDQVLSRRFRHYIDGDSGFVEKPDLLLIDGGVTHAQTAERALSSLGLSFPVFGMVKDDRHRTRALVTAEGREIGIQGVQAVFALIGQIQEEAHRFAITYHRALRSKRLRESVLDQIPGIGDVRKRKLLSHFKSVTAIEKGFLHGTGNGFAEETGGGGLFILPFKRRRCNMRVITGTARGVRLKTPEGLQTRPTTERVKEAVFSMIQFEVEGSRVLDLFAGTGQMGIEALSRGASSAVMVDGRREACMLVKENVKRARVTERAQVVQSDYLAYLERCGKRFDLIFLDPPYAEVFLENALNKISEIDILSDRGIIICERPAEKQLNFEVPGLQRGKDYRYGKTWVTVFRKADEIV